MSMRRWVAVGQGVYYLITSLWSLVSPRSFQRVTGPKAEYWLVQSMALMLGLNGGVMVASGLNGEPGSAAQALGIGTAASLAAIDIVHSLRGRIRRIYLIEAFAELVWMIAWVASPRMVRGVSRREYEEKGLLAYVPAPVLED